MTVTELLGALFIHLVWCAVLTIYGLIADLERAACSKPCIPLVKTSPKARLADVARLLDGLFFWILDALFDFWTRTYYVWSDLAIPNRVPMPHEPPHELTLSFTKENQM